MISDDGSERLVVLSSNPRSLFPTQNPKAILFGDYTCFFKTLLHV